MKNEMKNEIKRIYLDYNATTPLSHEVRVFFVDELDCFANASSLHEDGRTAASHIEKARAQIAALINAADPSEIIFTSGGSESNNTVFNTMQELNASGKFARSTLGAPPSIITSAIEHPCVLESSKRLAALGVKVNYAPVDASGRIDLNAYKKLLDEMPVFVSIMTANNEIGSIQDIKTLCDMAHKKGALFHTDAVQAAGKIALNVQDLGVDYATFSAHKIYAPKGVGALFVKTGSPLKPFVLGGHQEHGSRAGTYNAPAIAAYGEAALRAKNELASYEAHTRQLRNRLRAGLLEKVPNIKINGESENPADFDSNVLPNTLNVSFPGAEGEAILLHLDLLGIAVSTGSACASGSLEPSHVLGAIGLGPELAHGSIRFSLGKYTTEAEIAYVIEKLPKVIATLRSMSTQI
ncbi:MAG: aminotransferase class V-fold PLP-dependent enzyme [Treponemataceae bacterium]|nr:MAG: aminotransferase class V-fold PLP-dependent enzyme [Treponemataceae bacterium]